MPRPMGTMFKELRPGWVVQKYHTMSVPIELTIVRLVDTHGTEIPELTYGPTYAVVRGPSGVERTLASSTLYASYWIVRRPDRSSAPIVETRVIHGGGV